MAFADAVKRKRDEGMALVELSLVLMILVLLTFGVMEYGWMFFQIQQVTNAARAGAREAILPDTSNAAVQAVVDGVMTDSGLGATGYGVSISAGDVSTLNRGDAVTVAVAVPYGNIELLGMSIFPAPGELNASVTMAKEGP
jgi:Flp pilus assembly protein TadG